MTDLDRVIDGLASVRDYFMDMYSNEPDRDRYSDYHDKFSAVSDALDLLTDRLTPVKPKPYRIEYPDEYGQPIVVTGLRCGGCKKPVVAGVPYCPFCGREVKWDG